MLIGRTDHGTEARSEQRKHLVRARDQRADEEMACDGGRNGACHVFQIRIVLQIGECSLDLLSHEAP